MYRQRCLSRVSSLDLSYNGTHFNTNLKQAAVIATPNFDDTVKIFDFR
jgi:hypothetical protein